MRVNRRMQTVFYTLPALLVLFASYAFAQEMTERHIPVGAYPFLKSEYLTAGTIVAVEDKAGMLTVKEDGRERSFRLTEGTKIWLDRSRLGQPTLDGKLSDLVTGINVEVRSFGPERPDVAYWIKARVAMP